MMKKRSKQSIRVWLAVSVFLVGITAIMGCKSSETDSQAFIEARQEMDEQRHKAMIVSEPKTKLVQTAEQTTCPVMGMPIEKSIYTEYEDKKVYFCCPGCIDKFKASPSSYIAKLPQFHN
ncbi:MAG: YHS domain-containing protein [Sedimentisphaerales bacterium]|nr:YHS domain-containing protein [Sedimentisphaerales bacterium]